MAVHKPRRAGPPWIIITVIVVGVAIVAYGAVSAIRSGQQRAAMEAEIAREEAEAARAAAEVEAAEAVEAEAEALEAEAEALDAAAEAEAEGLEVEGDEAVVDDNADPAEEADTIGGPTTGEDAPGEAPLEEEIQDAEEGRGLEDGNLETDREIAPTGSETEVAPIGTEEEIESGVAPAEDPENEETVE